MHFTCISVQPMPTAFAVDTGAASTVGRRGPHLTYADDLYADGPFLAVGAAYADGQMAYAYGHLRRRPCAVSVAAASCSEYRMPGD